MRTSRSNGRRRGSRTSSSRANGLSVHAVRRCCCAAFSSLAARAWRARSAAAGRANGRSAGHRGTALPRGSRRTKWPPRPGGHRAAAAMASARVNAAAATSARLARAERETRPHDLGERRPRHRRQSGQRIVGIAGNGQRGSALQNPEHADVARRGGDAIRHAPDRLRAPAPRATAEESATRQMRSTLGSRSFRESRNETATPPRQRASAMTASTRDLAEDERRQNAEQRTPRSS